MGESEALLMDTDILIELQKQTPAAVLWFASLQDVPGITGFTAEELVAGCEDRRELSKAEQFLSAFEFLWPSETALETARKQFGGLRLSHGIGFA
jgi:predicted nucleic acid-binding protein